MAKVYVLGTGPLQESGATITSGQCLRTWHFCAPIVKHSHELRLATVPIPGTTKDDAAHPAEASSYRDQPYTKLLSNDPARILPIIEEELDQFRPDAIVGVNAYPAFLLAKLRRYEPFWADLNGWTMAEGQVRAAVLQHDRDFAHFWRMELETLLTADRFSTVTERQAWALWGELAMIGRLDHRTFAEDFVCAVPNAVYPDYAGLQRSNEMPAILKGKIPQDGLVCLWSGGFNSWTDVESLVEGLRRAFEEEPRLYFVATGGAIHGHDETTFERFRTLAKEKLPEGRYHLLGWIDFPEVLALHAWANCGINIDAMNTETRFGARNRLTNMLGGGLPVITTRGTEISDWIERYGAGIVFEPGDPRPLTDALVRSVRESVAMHTRLAEIRRAVRTAFAPENTLLKFLRWLRSPKAAADAEQPPHADAPPDKLRRLLLAEAASNHPFSGREFEETDTPSGLWRTLRSFTKGKR